MAAQSFRCSLCGITYPPLSKFSTCELCGEETSPFSNVKPDDDWQEQVEREKKRRVDAFNATEVKVDQYRFEQFTDLGLPLDMAMRAAGDHSIDLHVFARYLKDGCSPTTAFEILS